MNLTDGLIDGGEMDDLSMGFNWWLTPFFSFSMNYRWITLDQSGVESNNNGSNGRATLMLE